MNRDGLRRLDDANLSGGGQRTVYRALWELTVPATVSRKVAHRKLRVRIDRDSYDSQSYACADLFDGDKWNTIASLSRDRMDVLTLTDRGTKAVPVHTKEVDTARKFFEADEGKLLHEAKLILS